MKENVSGCFFSEHSVYGQFILVQFDICLLIYNIVLGCYMLYSVVVYGPAAVVVMTVWHHTNLIISQHR